MTYVRKGAGLRTQQRCPIHNRDLLWLDVNGYAILNVYRIPVREPVPNDIIHYITHLSPPPSCLIGGDFNAPHDMFEPGVRPSRNGPDLARWASNSGMDFIATPGESTQRFGHVLDLTFSNIPFAQSSIRPDMHSGSDHETQVTTIPRRGAAPGTISPQNPRGRTPQILWPSIQWHHSAKRPMGPTSTNQIDALATTLADIFATAIQTAGKPDRGGGCPAPWWTAECEAGFRLHLAARHSTRPTEVPLETREFLTTVRRAKREYWKHQISNIKDDKALYKIISWHKLASNLKAPPLVVNGVLIEDTMENAEALHSEVLGRFDAKDDLEQDPLADWDGTGHLQWNQAVSLEEVERNTIGVSSTSPGTDQVTVRLLKACWDHIKHTIHALISRCLALSHFPQPWKLAEVTMIPKVGKKDKTSVRSWQPIALLSCISKGLERTIARRVAWVALTSGILSPQHGGALPKRSAMDLVAAFTHEIETAFTTRQHATMITMCLRCTTG